jgi:hypothetical protein
VKKPEARPLLAAIAAAMLAAPPLAAQPVTIRRPAVLDAADAPLRWENIEGAPWLVRGAPAVRSIGSARDAVRLEPGGSVSVIVPAASALRLHATGGLAPSAVEIRSSDGFGLEAPVEPVPSLDGCSLIVPPSPFRPSLVQVERPATAAEPIEIALFISRVDHLPAEALHRTLVPLPGDAVWISGARWLPGVRHWLLEGGAPVAVDLEGPARFALVLRLVYPAGEASPIQGFDTRIAIDGRREAALLETSAGPRDVSWLGSSTILLGEDRAVHFEVPAGRHRVEIESSLDAYARLLRRSPRDLLLTSEPAPGPPPVFGRSVPEDSLGFLLGGGAREVFRSERPPGWTDPGIALSGPEVARILRDGSRRENGILGAMLSRDLAAGLSTHPDDRAVATLLHGRHARYRNLVPLEKRGSSPQRAAWFAPRRLAVPGEDAGTVALLDEHLDDALDNFSMGLFLEAPRSAEAAHDYALPGRFAPSLLRVVVELPAPRGRTDIVLEMDDGTRTYLRLRGGEGTELASVPARAEAALGAVLDRHGAGGSTLHGPLAASRFPAPLAGVTVAELPLPASARRVRLWAEGPSFRPRVALQHLAERPREPTELEYLAMMRRVNTRDPASSPLRLAFEAWSRGSAPAGIPATPNNHPADLAGAWIPLFRALDLARGRVLASAAPPERLIRPVDPGDGSSAEGCVDAAAALEKGGHWLPALEAWAGALASPRKETYRRARLRMMEALDRLGERFLAETGLRGLLLHDDDERLRHEALERLLARDADAAGDASGTDLLAFLALETGDPAVTRELAGAFAADGEHFFAIAVGLSLPAEELPVDALLRSSFGLRWWSLFESLLEGLEDEEEWHRWRGLRRAAAGDHEAALAHFAAAGPRGAGLERSLRGALAVREDLRSDDPDRRRRAVLAWESWQAERPGPMAWVEAPALVTGHDGSGAVWSESRDLHAQYYRARRGGAVRIEALGPATLRIEARPVHGEGSPRSHPGEPSRSSPAAARPMDAWLHVRRGELLDPVPITGNLPARGLVLTGSSGESPGGKVVHDVEIGPGLHAIEVGSPEADIIARVLVLEPEIPLGVLPPLTPATLERALHGPGGGAAEMGPPSGRARVVSRGGAESDHPIPSLEALRARAAPDPARAASWDGPGADPILAARIALREGSEDAIALHADGLRSLAADRGVPVEERFLALSRLGAASGPAGGAAVLADELEPGVRAAFLAGSGRLGDAIRVPEAAGAAAARRRMALLVHAAESAPDLRRVARVLGESLFREQPGVPGLQGLHHRLLRGTEWSQLESFRDTAGVRYAEVRGPAPESPELRVRKALLPPFEEEERLVTGDARLVASFSSPRAIVLDLEMRLEAVEFVPRSPIKALYSIDGEEPREVILSPGAGRRALSLLVPEGNRAVRIWIDEPVANHYLRLRLREAGKDGGAPGETGTGGARRRLYSIARAGRPLRLAVPGPVTLRFDELRDGRTITRYRHLLEGLHEVDLAPEGGHGEALVRVFTRVEGGAGREAAPVRSLEPVPVVPAPLVDLAPPERAALRIEDAFALGGQEDGTFSTGASFHHVERSSEDPDASGESDFFEGTAAFRRRHERIFTWSETGALGRAHLEGGPTFGLWEDIFHEGPWLPFALRLTGTGFVQWPDGGAMEPAGSPEWCLTLRGSASRRFPLGLNAYHLPSAALFGRLLSLHDGSEYDPDRLDPDVFTEYKDDHKAGLVLSETAGYRPWLDTEWWGRVALTSNQDLNPADPDQVSAWIGWKQYWDGWQIDVAFRAAWFFDDGDRADSREQQTIVVQVLRDWWVAPSHRLETGFELRHDFPDDETSGFVVVVWHFGNGRGYRDYRPGTIDFLPLRLAGSPLRANNRIAEAGLE